MAVAGDFILSTGDALRQMALRGMGPALLPHWAILDALSDGRLIDLYPTMKRRPARFKVQHGWYTPAAIMCRKSTRDDRFLKTHLPKRYSSPLVKY